MMPIIRPAARPAFEKKPSLEVTDAAVDWAGFDVLVWAEVVVAAASVVVAASLLLVDVFNVVDLVDDVFEAICKNDE